MYLGNKITTRDLRFALFDIKDQEMTVRELRSILFGIKDQDGPVSYFLISEMHDQNKKRD